jgi:hypothetical protein
VRDDKMKIILLSIKRSNRKKYSPSLLASDQGKGVKGSGGTPEGVVSKLA